MGIFRLWQPHADEYMFVWNCLVAEHTLEQLSPSMVGKVKEHYQKILSLNRPDPSYDIGLAPEFDAFWLAHTLADMGISPMLGPKSAKWFYVQNHRRGRWRAAEQGESLFRRVAGDILKEHGVEIRMDEPLPSSTSQTGQNYNPERIADQLSKVMDPGEPEFFAAYFQAVSPDESESVRMAVCMHLFPLAASHPLIHTTKNKQLSEALHRAHEIYLGRSGKKDQIVRLGDYVIWRPEREAVTYMLREKFNVVIEPSKFDMHEVRNGVLMSILAAVRNRTFSSDLDYGMSAAEKDSKQGLMLAFMAFGTSFTKQVLKIDSLDPNLTRAEKDRFQASIGFAGSRLGEGFFAVTDLFRKMGA